MPIGKAKTDLLRLCHILFFSMHLWIYNVAGQLSIASVTCRLFKLPKTVSTSDTPVQVTYKGDTLADEKKCNMNLRTIGTVDGHVEQFKLSYDLSLPVST